MDDADQPIRPKLTYYDFWHAIGSPKTVLGLRAKCSTQQLWVYITSANGRCVGTSIPYDVSCPEYRSSVWTTCKDDRPLFVQLAGDDPIKMLEAAKMVENSCDAVDINFGCPQAIARRGNYGAFLQDQWDTVKSLVSTLHQHLRVPVTCKMRKHFTLERTVGFARLLVESGCQVLCIHGRTRKQKGELLGLADFEAMQIVREAIPHVPFISNGNILTLDDVRRSVEATHCDAVMSAETLRRNPALFSGHNIPGPQLAREYLGYVERYPVHVSLVREHIHRFMLDTFDTHYDLRATLMEAQSLDTVREVLDTLDHRLTHGLFPPKAPSPPPVVPPSPEESVGAFSAIFDDPNAVSTSTPELPTNVDDRPTEPE